MVGVSPFDTAGCVRSEDGILRYLHRPCSLVAMLRRTVVASPTVDAIVEVGGERVSYATLWDRAASVAGGLRAGGVARGDRVGVHLGNGVDWAAAFFGIQLAGAIAVPINTRLTPNEVAFIVNDAGCRTVLDAARGFPSGSPLAVETQAATDVAAIFYTSGTTGFPKGAMLTHEGFLSNTETCRRVGLMPRHEPARTLVSVPLFHVTGCNSQLLTACESGSTAVILPAFDVLTFLRTIETEAIDMTLSVPAIYWRAITHADFGNYDVSRVKRLGYGGAPIAPDLVDRIMDAFPNARVANAFGLTETSGVATCLPHEYARLKPASVGLAAPVDDLQIDGASQPDEVGELLIRGPNVVTGYWNRPEATAEAIDGGWLRTGDLARIDVEGFVQILDRKKDMVNRGGEKVYCVEVENALVAHPSVFEVAVMGVPDPMMGERVGAVVVPRPGQRVDVGQLIDLARTSLADFKVPQYVVLRDELLPRNPGGKILKKLLRGSVDWGRPAW